MMTMMMTTIKTTMKTTSKTAMITKMMNTTSYYNGIDWHPVAEMIIVSLTSGSFDAKTKCCIRFSDDDNNEFLNF